MHLRNILVSIFLSFTLSSSAVAAEEPFIKSVNNGVTTYSTGATMTMTEYGEVFTLPSTLDVSGHPFFNVTRLLEMHAANETIPPLPGIPPLSPRPASSMMLPKGVAHCETSNASPNQMDVYVVSGMLDKIPDSWLCCVGPSLCTTMMWWYTAGSDICNWKSYNKCIHCDAASAAVYLIANKCAKNRKAGGFVRFGSEVDVNAYHTW
ncbi:hypothetical protein K440DRAFT_644222 [Wilcoxina mikolae CBS 423.85]|nr:hypothetical protein K440DRAFT_644222 [Wilcoxina mikolae CBS 423.85]